MRETYIVRMAKYCLALTTHADSSQLLVTALLVAGYNAGKEGKDPATFHGWHFHRTTCFQGQKNIRETASCQSPQHATHRGFESSKSVNLFATMSLQRLSGPWPTRRRTCGTCALLFFWGEFLLTAES